MHPEVPEQRSWLLLDELAPAARGTWKATQGGGWSACSESEVCAVPGSMALLPGITAGLASPPTCLVCGCVCGFCCSSFPFGNMCNAGYFPESKIKMLTSSRTPPSHQLVELTHFYLALRAMPASVPFPLSPPLHLTPA